MRRVILKIYKLSQKETQKNGERKLHFNSFQAVKYSFEQTSDGFPIEYPSGKRFNVKETSLSVNTITSQSNEP